jgi:glutaminyl-tRNA synthetase
MRAVKTFLQSLNPGNLKVLTTYMESSSAQEHPDEKFHFERIGYFVSDNLDHVTGKLVFNRGAG